MMRIVSKSLCWIAVVAWSLWFGGLIYEMIVILPLWSASLPESVLEWNARPQFVVNPTRFFAPVAITTVLSSALGLTLSWKTGNRRFWMFLSAFCAAGALTFTLIYFFPKNQVLFSNQTSGLSSEEITTIARSWISGNWIRVSVMAVGFFAALRAYGSDGNKIDAV